MMPGDPPDDLPDKPGSPQAGTVPRVVSSQELLAGGRELVIHHGAERYRLMLTGRNGLILTK